jgi:formylglycine-generating enzyme required for sulfatase activity
MSATAVGCARCGTILDPNFRFCPECALPAQGETVLSTEIADLRRRVEAQAAAPKGAPWGRYLGLVGLLLFNQDLMNRLLPAVDEGQSAQELIPRRPRIEPQWESIAPGTFPFGPPAGRRTATIPYAFRISKHEVTNELWLDFLRSEGRRLVDLGLWQEAFPRQDEAWKSDGPGVARLAPERRTYPVTNVSPNAIGEFCDWMTRRLAEPGVQIRMPTQLEWEYAARGADARTYTWGEGDVSVPIPYAGGDTRLRTGIKSRAVRVDDPQLVEDDLSAKGVVAMGTNVAEWTLMVDLDERKDGDAPEREVVSDIPSLGLGEAIRSRFLNVAWRGASFAHDAEAARRLAQVWERTPSEPTAYRDNIGVRLVRVRTGK